MISEKLEQLDLDGEMQISQLETEVLNTQAEQTNSEGVNQNVISANVSGNTQLELVKCPKCASFVRVDRLEKHIKRVHDGIGVARSKKSKLRLGSFSTSSRSGINRCRHCGRQAIYGDDTCYSCNPK